MKYIQGGPSGGSIINGGPAPTVPAPLLSMSVAWFSNPISLVSGFAAPDMVTISIPFTVAGNPQGLFFLQGAISGFAVLGSVPSGNDWFTLPNTPIPIAPGTYNQTINSVSLPPQPATFRLNTAIAPIGALFLRVGWAPNAGSGIGDTASVYAVAIANITA